MINFTKEQKEILKYTSGNMCISAVPGAGKTFILTHLAYNLSKILKNDEQILVLTYMNSATFNFYNNLKNFMFRLFKDSLKKGFMIYSPFCSANGAEERI